MRHSFDHLTMKHPATPLKLPPKRLDRRPDGTGLRAHRRTFDSQLGGLNIATSSCHDEEESTGGDVWLGAFALARWLVDVRAAAPVLARLRGGEDVKAAATAAAVARQLRPTVLELGSGTGLGALAAATAAWLGARQVLCTDIETQLPLLRENIASNAAALCCPLSVGELDWKHPDFQLSGEGEGEGSGGGGIAEAGCECGDGAAASQPPLLPGGAEGARVRDMLGTAVPDLILCADLLGLGLWTVAPLMGVLDALCAPAGGEARTIVLFAQSHRLAGSETALAEQAQALGFVCDGSIADDCPDAAALLRADIAFFALCRGGGGGSIGRAA